MTHATPLDAIKARFEILAIRCMVQGLMQYGVIFRNWGNTVTDADHAHPFVTSWEAWITDIERGIVKP